MVKHLPVLLDYWIRAEHEQVLHLSKTVGNSLSTATPVASARICKTTTIFSKESNVNNNLSLEERVNLLNTELIAMQFFIIDQLLILKQSLKDSTLEKSTSDISSEVKRLKELNDILRQQNENLLQENSSKNTTMQLLSKNQEYLNKSVCNTLSDETFKTVTKGPLKQGNNIEISKINCRNRFEVLSTTDDDDGDDNDSKSEKIDNTIINDFLIMREIRKKQKGCITNRKHKKNALPIAVQIRTSRIIMKIE